MITNLRSGIVAGVLAVTTAVAGIGWYRSSHAQPTGGYPYTTTGLNSSPANLNSNFNDPNGAQPFNNATNAGYNSGVSGNPNYNNCDSGPSRADYGYSGAPYVSDRYVQSIHRPIRVSYARSEPYSTGYVERTHVVERYRRGRSTGKSVAIVAGTAAGGAAIGALAGGGKGAAIGALTGGLGGFVYDRLTHNR